MVAHAADITPGLARHQFLGAFTKPICGVAYPPDAALDGITCPSFRSNVWPFMPTIWRATCSSMAYEANTEAALTTT